MKKIDGLRFLQTYFPDLTVDCLFIENEEDLDYKKLYNTDPDKQLWRVRGSHKYGSELNLPQGTFSDPNEVKSFIRNIRKKDSDMEFIIHRVTPEYFEPPYVGTLSIFNSKNKQALRIELQRVTKELISAMDKGGKRPRDWETCLILEYDFFYKVPKIEKKNENINIENLKYPIMLLYRAGERILEEYEKRGIKEDTYTRFNINKSGEVLFDDHRGSDSFISKYFVETKNKRERDKLSTNRIKPEIEER